MLIEHLESLNPLHQEQLSYTEDKDILYPTKISYAPEGSRGTDFTAVETVTLAKFLIFSRTMEIPLSSDALSSNTRVFINSGLYTYVNFHLHQVNLYPKSSLHKARIVEVFPVPGGP